MSIEYTFTANAFPPVPGEDSELINEGTYGKALLDWYSKEIQKRGCVVGDFIPEDFGWYAYLKVGSSKAGVACSVIHDTKTDSQECHLTIEPCGWLMKFFGSSKKDFEQLVQFTDEILNSNIEIGNIQKN